MIDGDLAKLGAFAALMGALFAAAAIIGLNYQGHDLLSVKEPTLAETWTPGRLTPIQYINQMGPDTPSWRKLATSTQASAQPR